jgi:phosphohistidine phosphatase SixA
MKTKKVIFIRHGDYIPIEPFNLSEQGKEKINNLALKLFHEIEYKEVILITSIANRAVQTSEILKNEWNSMGINITFEKYYELWSGSDANKEAKRLEKEEQKFVSVYNQRWLHKFIESCNKKTIIVVSHLEIVESSPLLLGFSSIEVSKGQARVLDLETKKEIII